MKTPFLLAALAALALPAAADQTVTFITGTIDSLEAEGYTDANGNWKWSEGAAAPTVSESNGVRRIAFSLGAGQSLEYHPVAECPTNGTAEVVVFDTTPPAIEPGEGLAEGDPPAIEMKDGRFLVRFRTRRAGVTYTLVSSAVLTREDAAWKPVGDEAAVRVSSASAESGDGELVELSAPVPDDQPVQFYRIRAGW